MKADEAFAATRDNGDGTPPVAAIGASNFEDARCLQRRKMRDAAGRAAMLVRIAVRMIVNVDLRSGLNAQEADQQHERQHNEARLTDAVNGWTHC